jgi:ABC-type branched-subunit amino acid transport system ATPase component
LLELEGLEVRYGTVPAVRDVTLKVERGEVIGLIGPNGAGKSTTLNAIMGVIPAHAGDVRLDGRSVRGKSPEAISRSGVALVPEGRRIFGDFTVEENLRLGLAGRKRNGADRLAEAASSAAASSSSSRSRGRSSPTRSCSSWTSLRSALRRWPWTRSSTRSAPSASAA